MTEVDPNAASQGRAENDLQRGSTSTGFATLAKRISDWTTKCILSAVVLVAGLVFGRQVLDWWAADQQAAPVSHRPVTVGHGIADSPGPHHIQFGESPWRLTRRSFVGDREEAIAALRSDCRKAIAACSFPEGAAPEAENSLLESLAEREPVDAEPGEWELYELDGPYAMVAGTRQDPLRSDPTKRNQVARAVRRVVIWGLGVPVRPQTWTLDTFHLAGWSDRPVVGLPDISIPPGSSRTISLRASHGGGMVAFKGSSQPEDWQAFFDRWFLGRGWTAGDDWRRSGGGWHRRYAAGAGQPPASVDVRFGPGTKGQLSGLLTISLAQGQGEGD